MEAFDALTPAQKEQFLNGPALSPPPGVVPNFTDAPNRTALCFGITITCVVLVTFGAIIRLYTRIFCIKKMRVEDYLMIAALGLFAGFVYIEMALFVFPGGFVHQWDIRVKDTPPLLRGINIGSIIYGFVVILLKACIFLDWIQIFTASSGVRGVFYYCCIANIVANIVFYIPLIFIDIFACIPRHKIWNVLEHGKCLDLYPGFVASSIFNFVLDMVMLTMPMHAIWRLRLPLRKKIGVSSLFLVGIFGCICGALRIPYSLQLLRSTDKFYSITGSAVAGTGEMAAGFLVLCIPSIPKLFKSSPTLQKFFSKLQCWIGLSSNESKPNSRLGLPSWIRAQGQRNTAGRGPADTVCSEFDGYFSMPLANNGHLSHSTTKEGDIACSEHHKEQPEMICRTEFITVHEV